MGQLLDAIYAEQKQQLQSRAPQPKKGKKGLVGDILSSIIDPFQKTAKTIGGGAFEIGRFGASLVPGIGDKAYIRASGKTVENPFLSQKELGKYGSDPLGAILDQAKASAGVASFAVPFGKGASFASKALIPGAKVGGLQALSQEEVTPESVVGGALTGAAGAGLFRGATNLLGKTSGLVGKASPALERGAQNLEQGTRQIRQKPSVFGASAEKEINKTLTKYKVKGSPQKQYEALETTMKTIEGRIKSVIKANPNVTVPKEGIKESFITNLKSSLRSKDLTQKQAISEVGGYLKDLLKASGGKGRFTNISLEKLRELKKLVNVDYGPVHEIAERGGTLSPRQKVIAAAWDSLDQAVKNASPAMKALLKDESNLYKSAQSLSAARSNPPTLRFMGTSIPANVTQKGKDVLGDILRASGKKVEGVSRTAANVPALINNPLMQNILGQAGARLPQITNNGENQPSYEANTDNQYNLNGESIISQDSMGMLGPGQQASANPYPLENYIQDIQRDPKNVALYKEIFDQYQEQFKQPKQIKQSAQVEKAHMSLNSAEQIANQIERLVGGATTGPVTGNVLGFLGKTTGGALATNEAEYEAYRQAAIGPLARAISGEVGVLNEGDIRRAEQLLPKLTDARELVNRKLKNLRSAINERRSMLEQTSGGGEDYSALLQYLGQ